MLKKILPVSTLLFFLFLQHILLGQCPRETAVNDYNNLYLTSSFNLAEMNWTGNVGTCNAGTISQTVLNKNLQRK